MEEKLGEIVLGIEEVRIEEEEGEKEVDFEEKLEE